jgi:hypothetical protein
MYLSLGFLLALTLVLLSPVIWVGWWLLADLGEKVSGGQPAMTHFHSDRELPRAA